MAPPFLPSGAASGVPLLGEATDGATTATWGAGTADEITQVLTDRPDQSFEIALRFDEIVSVGELEAAVVPVGPPLGPIGISLRDRDETCVRQYVTPGSLGDDGIAGSLDEEAADAYAMAWLEALDM